MGGGGQLQAAGAGREGRGGRGHASSYCLVAYLHTPTPLSHAPCARQPCAPSPVLSRPPLYHHHHTYAHIIAPQHTQTLTITTHHHTQPQPHHVCPRTWATCLDARNAASRCWSRRTRLRARRSWPSECCHQQSRAAPRPDGTSAGGPPCLPASLPTPRLPCFLGRPARGGGRGGRARVDRWLDRAARTGSVATPPPPAARAPVPLPPSLAQLPTPQSVHPWTPDPPACNAAAAVCGVASSQVRHRHGLPGAAARHLHLPAQGALQPEVPRAQRAGTQAVPGAVPYRTAAALPACRALAHRAHSIHVRREAPIALHC